MLNNIRINSFLFNFHNRQFIELQVLINRYSLMSVDQHAFQVKVTTYDFGLSDFYRSTNSVIFFVGVYLSAERLRYSITGQNFNIKCIVFFGCSRSLESRPMNFRRI